MPRFYGVMIMLPLAELSSSKSEFPLLVTSWLVKGSESGLVPQCIVSVKLNVWPMSSVVNVSGNAMLLIEPPGPSVSTADMTDTVLAPVSDTALISTCM